MSTETRRSFLRSKCLVTAAAAGSAILAMVTRRTPLAQASGTAGLGTTQSTSPEQRLRELGIELPPPPRPIGVDMTVEDAHAAARIAGLNLLSTVRNTLGSLDNVVQLVKVLGMVNCAPDFGQQPQVINGFSELLVEVFGEERGRGGRAAVGMASLPANQPVEVEAIFEVRG